MIETMKEPQKETKEIRHEVILITPEIAADMLSRSIRNRRLMQNTVNNYAQQIERGEWQLTPQGISFNEYNELIDGQHRLNGVIKSGKAVKMFVFYNVPDSCFKVLDTGNKRTPGQIFGLENIKHATNIAAALRKLFVLQNCNENDLIKAKVRAKASSSYLLDFYYKNKDLIDNVTAISINYYKTSAFYTRSEIISIILYLHMYKKHSLSIIEGFFNQLFLGRLINNVNIEMLRSKLIQSALLKSHKIRPASKLIYLKKVWNAIIDDKIIKRLSDENDLLNPIDFK